MELINFNKYLFKIINSKFYDSINKRFIDISLLLSIFYLIVRYFDTMILYPKSLGDEHEFIVDMHYILANGYIESVIRGMSIPFTMLSLFFYNKGLDLSQSLRFTNSLFTILPILYLLLRNNILKKQIKKILFFLFVLIGTSGGQFYGTNDTIFFSSFIILVYELTLAFDKTKLNFILIFIFFTIFILSRPHFILYLLPLLIGFIILNYIKNKSFLFYIDKSIFFPIFISILLVLLINIPRFNNGIFSLSHSNKIYTSYKGKDVNWTEWHYYSQMKGNKNRLGFFAPMASWDEVRKFKKNNPSETLPDSYWGYLLHNPFHIIQRVPISIIEVILMSIRYIGIFIFLIPIMIIYKIKNNQFDYFLLFLLFSLIGIIIWIIIWPHFIEPRWLYPYYFFLIYTVVLNKKLQNNYFINSSVFLNIVLMDFIILWYLWKMNIFSI